jgi:uncharacterized protein (TIGR00369 family)
MSDIPSVPTPANDPRKVFPAGTAFDPLLFMQMMPKIGHAGWLGMAYANHGADWVELELPYDAKLIGDSASGVLASGPIISLMDNCTSMSVWIKLGRFVPQATLDLRIDYMRAAVPGRTVIGHGECYKLTRTIAFVRGTAHDGDPDDPLAHAIGTFMVSEGTYL